MCTAAWLTEACRSPDLGQTASFGVGKLSVNVRSESLSIGNYAHAQGNALYTGSNEEEEDTEGSSADLLDGFEEDEEEEEGQSEEQEWEGRSGRLAHRALSRHAVYQCMMTA